jgi:hypothetical protein
LEEKMKFDYCEFENKSEQTMEIDIGCRFEDEPDELYVIQISLQKDEGKVQELKLVFNRMDCKYVFKPEEKIAIADYIHTILPTTAYADWFKGRLLL